MAMTSQLQHLQTFAHLRQAVTGDIDDLIALQHSLSPLHPISGALWQHFVETRGARVTLAIEGGVIVGAAVEVHRLRSPVAKLFALGVTQSARGRGIGYLLLDAVITQARAEGAAVLWAEAPSDQKPLRNLLEGAGFRSNGNENGRTVRYGRSLWNPRHSPAFNEHEPPHFLCRDSADSGVCALMMAMGTIDRSVMLTPRLQSVLRQETGGEGPESDVSQGAALALSAVRRGFRVILHPADLVEVASKSLHAETANQRILPLDTPPTPEQLIGYLSRGHVPMIQCRLTRLHRQKPAHWVLVAGFDGYLFRIVDPEIASAGAEAQFAVTMGELRAGLRGSQPCRPSVLVLLKSAVS